MKTCKYTGGYLIRCPRSRESGVLTGGRSSSTGGTFSPLVTSSSPISLDGASPSMGVFPYGPSLGSGSRGVRHGAGSGGPISAGRSSRLSLPGLPPVAQPPYTRVHAAVAHALLSASRALATEGAISNRIGASPTGLQASLILDGHLS